MGLHDVHPLLGLLGKIAIGRRMAPDAGGVRCVRDFAKFTHSKMRIRFIK